jgi:hypothetical protein
MPQQVSELDSNVDDLRAAHTTSEMAATTTEMTPEVAAPKKRVSTRAPRKRLTQRKAKEYCVCKGKDDGRPMIRCENCHDW